MDDSFKSGPKICLIVFEIGLSANMIVSVLSCLISKLVSLIFEIFYISCLTSISLSTFTWILIG
jgi:hypothetical protein